jgi:hypothetical protein
MKYSSLIQLAAVFLLIACAIFQQRGIDANRGFIADQDRRYESYINELAKNKNKEEVLRAQYLYMPEGNSLAVLTLGNTSLAADYFWLTSLQYVVNSFRRGSKFEMLLRFYTTMLDLQPQWSEAAVKAGKILSALERDRYAVEKFYIHALTANPDNLRLHLEAGRLFVVPPLDIKQQSAYSARAIFYFKLYKEKVLKKLGPAAAASREIRNLDAFIARLGMEAGYYQEAARLLLEQARDQDNPKAMRQSAAREFLNARSILLVNQLQSIVDEYKKQRGAAPPDLTPIFNVLPDKGASAKEDGFGLPIEYDSSSGRVSSRGVKAYRALHMVNVVQALIGQYRDAHEDKPPGDLGELTRWVREFYGPHNPPGPAIREALGDPPDCELCPLGRWNYDPKDGTITLPKYCDQEMLFKNADKMTTTERKGE